MKNKAKDNTWIYFLFLCLMFGGFFYMTVYYEPPIEEQAKEEYGLTKVKNGYGVEKYLVHYGSTYDPNYAKSRGMSSGQVLKEFKNLEMAEKWLKSLREEFIKEYKEKQKAEFKVQ